MNPSADGKAAPLFLIGYMGCGKTTLGRALERMAGIEFVDLDQWIERDAGMSVSDIFATEGEESFRTRESLALRTVARPGVVVACGGGTPCRPGNMEFMNACGTTVLLEAPLEVLARRLAAGRSTRPLIAKLTDSELPAFIESRLSERMGRYSLAAHRFDSSRLEDADQIESTANKFIATFLCNNPHPRSVRPT